MNRCADHLKECDTPVIDYYANNMVDVALVVLNAWLMLRDARLSERKRAIAHVYIAEHLPKAKGAAAAIQAADPTPLQVRDIVLAGSF
jgi:hypothetical protein